MTKSWEIYRWCDVAAIIPFVDYMVQDIKQPIKYYWLGHTFMGGYYVYLSTKLFILISILFTLNYWDYDKKTLHEVGSQFLPLGKLLLVGP